MSITSDRIREYGFIHDLADAAADEIYALEAEIAELKSKLDGEKAAALNYRADAIKAEKCRVRASHLHKERGVGVAELRSKASRPVPLGNESPQVLPAVLLLGHGQSMTVRLCDGNGLLYDFAIAKLCYEL